MHITTAVGRSLLRTIGGSDVKYASEPQFEIVKDVAHGAWLLRHQPSARNPTYCDGIDVGSESLALVDGARLTIGRAKLRLTVNLEDG